MRAWKYVSEKYSESFSEGNLRLGSLESYGKIEGNRIDDIDGAIRYHEDLTIIQDGNLLHPENLAYMRKVGIQPMWAYSGPNANVLSAGNIYIKRSPKLFAFCMSEVGADDFSGENGNKFLIKGVRIFANAVFEQLAGTFLEYRCSKVLYRIRSVRIGSNNIETASPFIKDNKFAAEKEVRIIFVPKKHISEDAIYTKPDRKISSMIEII